MSGRIVITGAAGALGRSVVERFLAAGARVLAVGESEAHLATLAALARGSAGQLVWKALDVGSGAAVARLFDELEGEDAAAGGSALPGHPDPPDGTGTVLPRVVHLIGGFRYAPLKDLSDADWTYLLRVNLETTFQVCRECARRFERAHGGVLVAVSSPAALLGEAGVGGYAATKAGVLRLIESLAREIGPFGGRANAVLPGTMDTPANRSSMPDADPARWVSTAAVAEIIHFLTTPEAAGINGAAVPVPGPCR
ncbi:MAG: SDR family NAD(P)-dependent oxidoreductase [Acidobacteriota bacterium]|nr:SDR family NAD(P)-dependent oxidoreductase [Acidobacteriota bacterium]